MAGFTALPYEIQHQILCYALPVDLCRQHNRSLSTKHPVDTFKAQAMSIIYACSTVKEIVIKVCLTRLHQREADYNQLAINRLHINDKHRNGLTGGCQCYSMRYSGSTYAMDEFYLEGGFGSSLTIMWAHDSSPPTPCLEIQKRQEKEEERMGYPADSCQKMRTLLVRLKPIEFGIEESEYQM